MFIIDFKEKWRARDMQLLRPQASIGCCGLSISITALIFSGQAASVRLQMTPLLK
jgi:hypothetical protein